MDESLGLSSVRVTDPGTSPWSFDWLRHEIAEPPSYAVRTATWLIGERHGVSVVVRPVKLPGDQPYVAIVAEIDPPMFAGLHLVSTALIEPFRFQPQGTAIGIDPIDRSFAARAADPHRALRIFTRSAPNDTFAWDVGRAGDAKALRIDDRTVASYVAGVWPGEEYVRADLDLVSTLARRFSERMRLVPERADETEARESWARVAAGWSLGFDPARWKIRGEHEGRRIEAILEGVPPAISTVARVSFRMPLGAGVFIRTGIREKKKISASGHSELDRFLLFDARDRERALAAVADPNVRSALGGEARSSNVTMTDWSISSARGGFMRGRELSARIETLAAIVDRVTPLLRTAGPFR